VDRVRRKMEIFPPTKQRSALLEFAGQGQATEDAATLADCLEAVDERSVEEAMQRYQDLRRPRANRILIGSRGREIRNHLPDGPEQRPRDEDLAAGEPKTHATLFSTFATWFRHIHEARSTSSCLRAVPPTDRSDQPGLVSEIRPAMSSSWSNWTA
jgi:hypothetical protein